MRGYLGARIAQIIPTLLLVSLLVFSLQQRGDYLRDAGTKIAPHRLHL